MNICYDSSKIGLVSFYIELEGPSIARLYFYFLRHGLWMILKGP